MIIPGQETQRSNISWIWQGNQILINNQHKIFRFSSFFRIFFITWSILIRFPEGDSSKDPLKVGCFVVFQLRLVYFIQLLLDLFSVNTHRMMAIILLQKRSSWINSVNTFVYCKKCRQEKKAPSVLIFKITKGNLSEVNNVRNQVNWLIFLLKGMCQHWSRETPHKCMWNPSRRLKRPILHDIICGSF